MSTALRSKALGKETGDEQGDVADTLQQVVAMLDGRSIGSVGKHQRERPEPVAFPVIFVEFI